MINTFFNIVADGEKIPSTLEKDEKKYETELTKALTTFQNRTSCKSLTLLPNFDFGWLLPPIGYVSNYSLNSFYNSDPFRSSKYQIFAKAKIKMDETSYTTERQKEMERNIRLAFPGNTLINASIDSKVEDGWTPSLGGKGSSIGIYRSSYKESTQNNLVEEYFIICHTTLNYDLLSSLQVYEEQCNKSTREYIQLISEGATVIPDSVKGYTYDDLFGSNSVNEKALELAKENAARLITIFASIIDVDLHNTVFNTRNTYESCEGDSNKHVGVFQEVLKWWPSEVPIYPFTVLPSLPIENNRGEQCPKQIFGFPLGYKLDKLKKDNLDDFTKLVEKFKLEFINEIKTVVPDIITEVNTFRIFNNELIWYCNSTPCDSNGGILLYEGLDIGFKHLNPIIADTEYVSDWKNDYFNAFPVLFPFVQDVERTRTVKQDSISKCFTLTKGGISSSTFRTIPDQFYGLFANLAQLDSNHVKNKLRLHGVNSLHLIPVKIFLSSESFNISRF